MKTRLLLHSCCAPCSIYVLRELAKDYELSVFFYDPNIHPRLEYIKRRDEMKNYVEKINRSFSAKGRPALGWEEGDYDTKNWFIKTEGLENEPERGKRCEVCFDIRLSATAQKAKAENYDIWTTVMSISPHKDVEQINCAGQRLAKEHGVEFIKADWKKNEGFKVAVKMSKEEGFYRQDYCGCVYSKIERAKIKQARQYEN